MASPKPPEDPDPNSKIDIPTAKKPKRRTITITVTGKSSTSGNQPNARQKPTMTTQPQTVVAPPQFSPADLEHKEWLQKIRLQVDKPPLAHQWSPHKQWSISAAEKKFHHFTALDFETDHQYIWRFSSLPSSELVSIQAGTAIATIIELIGEHSGGNKKDDPRVRTSSFCRNIGALIGVAASTGGDKKVLNIVNRTPYLCRIDISTLSGKGVSAVPALSRAISLFETEYVLVPTPGKTHFLANTGQNVIGGAGCLDAAIFSNPFFGCIGDSGTFTGCVINQNVTIGAKEELPVTTPAAFTSAGAELRPVTPELIGAIDMDEGDVVRILCYAAAVSEAADKHTDVIKDKDPTSVDAIADKVAEYASAVEKLYREYLPSRY
ncbi:hypothetical protein AB0E01_10445 [Nocardia vinacea]|uniref:hypothetical protein n=1 Tax=Nocardia vinacea TaxID=96468 RepID=UPI0033ED4B04